MRLFILSLIYVTVEMVVNSKPRSVSISSSLFIGYGIALPYFVFVTYGLAKHLEIGKTALAFGLLTKIATGILTLISIGILFTELGRKKDEDDKFGLRCIMLETFGSDCGHQHTP